MALTLQDRLEIIELANRFEILFDSRALDENAATLLEDAVFESTFGNFDGRAAYRAWLGEFYDTMGAGKRHVVSNHAIDGDGDEARMLSYLTILEREGPPRVVATARVEDVVRRTPDGWRFARRRIDVDPGMFASWESGAASPQEARA